LKEEEEEWENNLKIVLGNCPILFFYIWEENDRWSPNIVPPKYWKNLEISIRCSPYIFSPQTTDKEINR
jgi:hypothetical protein